LYQLVENIKYEVKQYVEQKKWAVKQGELFDDNPFGEMATEVSVEGIDIPQADVEAMEEAHEEKKMKKVKKVKKSKNAA